MRGGVRLQDPNEKPSKADPKYFEKARVALLKKVESGQDVTYRMLQKEKQRLRACPSAAKPQRAADTAHGI